MKASDVLVESLVREGVEYAFGVPGEELEDFLFSVRDSEMEFIPVRHEQGAAFMADVHGRLTGDAGVCVGTLGPGATNLLTGVADAHLDKSPLVAITGQGGRERLHKESHQAIDVVDMYEPVVKWNTSIREPEVVPESVRKAFKLSEYEKPGATHIELPEDVAAEETEERTLPSRDRVRRPSPDPQSVETAAQLLDEAERPLVLAGNGAVRTRASESLRDFVEAVDLPVASTYMGKGAVSDRSRHSLMTINSGDGASREVVDEADVVMAVGYDIAEHDPAEWNEGRDKTVVHLDFEPAEVYAHYNPDVEIVGDVAASLDALGDAVTAVHDAEWCREESESVHGDAVAKPDAEASFTVSAVLPYLREVMADDDVLISDVGSHKMAIAQEFPTYEPNTCIVSNGLASMGIGVPGGVAADLAIDEEVVVATGDGGFLMNGAELETAVRRDCEFTVVVFDDEDYGLISEKQEAHRGEHTGTGLTTPDLPVFAESFGVEGYRVEDWDDLESTLEQTVGSDEMSLVAVPLGR